jgi:hypothetical protein
VEISRSYAISPMVAGNKCGNTKRSHFQLWNQPSATYAGTNPQVCRRRRGAYCFIQASRLAIAWAA